MKWYEKWQVTEHAIDPMGCWYLKREPYGWKVWHYNQDTHTSYGLLKMAKDALARKLKMGRLVWTASRYSLGSWDIRRVRNGESVLWGVYLREAHQMTCTSLVGAKDYVKGRITLAHVDSR